MSDPRYLGMTCLLDLSKHESDTTRGEQKNQKIKK